jgi:hypothetical protein
MPACRHEDMEVWRLGGYVGVWRRCGSVNRGRLVGEGKFVMLVLGQGRCCQGGLGGQKIEMVKKCCSEAHWECHFFRI